MAETSPQLNPNIMDYFVDSLDNWIVANYATLEI